MLTDTLPPTLDEDLLATVGTLFGIEHDLQDRYQDLEKAEKKLFYDIGELLQNMHQWIAQNNSNPYDGLPMMRRSIFWNGADVLCQQYASEIECWAERNQEQIDNVIQRAVTWKFPE